VLGLAHRLDATEAGAAPPRVDIFVVANLGEQVCVDALTRVLDAIEELVRVEFQPIFEDFRLDHNANLAIVPIVALPHPPHPDAVRLLLDLEAGHLHDPPVRPHLRQLYLVEDVGTSYVLSRADLAAMFATWLNFLVYGALRNEPAFRELYRSRARGDLFATFSIATAEYPAGVVTDYCAGRFLLEALARLSVESDDRPDVARRVDDAAQLVDMSELDAAVTREKGVHNLEDDIARHCGAGGQGGTANAVWSSTPAAILRGVGPHWHEDEVARLEAAVIELRRFVLGPVLSEVERGGSRLVRQKIDVIEARNDARMGGGNDQTHHVEALLEMRQVEGRIDAQLEQVEAKVGRPLGGLPDFGALRDTWNDFLAHLGRLPHIGRVLGWGLPLVVCVGLALWPVLGYLASLFNYDPLRPPWYYYALLEYGWATGLAVSALVFGSWLFYRHFVALRHVQDFVGRAGGREASKLQESLDTAVNGPDDSARSYFSRRFERSRDLWALRALRRLRHVVHGEVERLEAVLATVQLQRERIRAHQEALGVRFDGDTADASGVIPGGTLLRRPVVGPAALETAYQKYRRPSELSDAVRALRDQLGPVGWREGLPYGDTDALLDFGRGCFVELRGTSPFALRDLEDDVRARLADFLRDLGPSLDHQLNFTGQEDRDPDGVRHSIDRWIVAPQGAQRLLEGARDDAGALEWELHPILADATRVHLLRVTTDIRGAAIRSLGDAG
jgi:hypothetical protein